MRLIDEKQPLMKVGGYSEAFLSVILPIRAFRICVLRAQLSPHRLKVSEIESKVFKVEVPGGTSCSGTGVGFLETV